MEEEEAEEKKSGRKRKDLDLLKETYPIQKVDISIFESL